MTPNEKLAREIKDQTSYPMSDCYLIADLAFKAKDDGLAAMKRVALSAPPHLVSAVMITSLAHMQERLELMMVEVTRVIGRMQP